MLNLILDNNDADKLSTPSIKIKDVNYHLPFVVFKKSFEKTKKTAQKEQFHLYCLENYFHLILQPKLGLWISSCGSPAKRFSKAIIKSSPVRSLLFPGLESSICPL